MIVIQENIQDNIFMEMEYLTKLDLLAQIYLKKKCLKTT